MANTASEYSVFDTQKYEVHNKAQVLVYAHLTQQELGTKNEIENALTELYERYKNETGYQNFERPTVVGVYLYTSEKIGRESKSSWLAMLVKGPSDAEPQLHVDELKFKSLKSLDANEGTEDEIELENLNKVLFERGLELCSFNKRLKELHLACIHKADAKFPDYGPQHQAYIEKLWKETRNEIHAVHDTTDEILGKVDVFAMVYCR